MIAFAYTLSGIAALWYELVWIRELTLFCGHTTLAVSAVLTAFMGGLALGSVLVGRHADSVPRARLLRLFAKLEIGAALTALLTKPLLSFLGAAALSWGLASWSGPARSIAYFSMAFGVLLVPTTLMGATLPVLTRRFGERELAALYGVNTLGAVIGTATAGFALLPMIGVAKTMLCAAALNTVAAVIAITSVNGRQTPPSSNRSQQQVPVSLLMLLGVTGAAAMICEVAWTRAFSLVLGSTTYAFTIMLTTFLTGLAGGSLAFRIVRTRWSRPPSRRGLAVILIIAGACVFAGLYAFEWFPYAVVRTFKWAHASPGRLWTLQFAFCSFIMFGPTFMMGAVFPFVLAIAAPGDAKVAEITGRCYAANTGGAIIGSAAAGLLLIPAFGVTGCLLLASILYFLSAAVCIDSRKTRAALLAASAAALLLQPKWNQRLFSSGMFLYGKYYRWVDDAAEFQNELDRDSVLFYKSGANATVTVLESPHGERYLRVNGKTDASEGGDMGTQLLLGYLPSLLHPGTPKNALVIGLGAGLSAGAIATQPGIEQITIVEIEPVVAQAARYFARSNRAVLEDPRVSLKFADARQVLASPGPSYDIISSEPSNPWIAGIGYLFTREAFQAARDRLNEDGVFIQWFHAYFMAEEDFRMVVRTFQDVFPHAMLMTDGEADYFLVGRQTPWRIDYPRMQKRFREDSELRSDLRRIGRGFDHPFTLLASAYSLGGEDLKRYTDGAPIHRDDRPVLEFHAARSLHLKHSTKILRGLGRFKTDFLPPGVEGLIVTDRERGMLFDKAAETLLETSQIEKAEKAITRAMSYTKKSARSWTNQARLLEKREDFPGARKAFLKAVSLDRSYAPGRIHFGLFLASRGEIEIGLAHLHAGLALEPGDALASLGLAWIHLARYEKAEARALIETVLGRPVPDTVLRKNLVQAYRKAGGLR
ncbi:MAG: hypothetical protein COB53_03550 [Elusimicrobia bacterium]|nr:MAG: hypothetical protein COB53_03550 [Elusimicrobiota bacterium]